MKRIILSVAFALTLGASLSYAQVSVERRAELTPDVILTKLMQGNERFAADKTTAQDITARRAASAKGQFPKAVILSCLDSRVPVENVFDLGIGDVFVGRVAGNIEDSDQLGSMEFATKLAGAKLVMVLGHTACGAVAGSVDNARLGHLSGILKKIRPAVDVVKKNCPDLEPVGSNAKFVDKAAEENVRRTVKNIRRQSPILANLEKSGQIKIVGGMYDLKSGRVTLVK